MIIQHINFIYSQQKIMQNSNKIFPPNSSQFEQINVAKRKKRKKNKKKLC